VVCADGDDSRFADNYTHNSSQKINPIIFIKPEVFLMNINYLSHW